MRLPLPMILAVAIIGILADVLIWRSLRRVGAPRRLQIFHKALAALAWLTMIIVVAMPKKTGDDAALRHIMWTLFAFMTLYIPKALYALFEIVRLALSKIFKHRMRAIGIVGASFAAVLFVAMWWGALINRYCTDVVEVEVPIAGLPDSFDGMKIAQISDLHLGTYGDDTSFPQRLVEEVNALNSDIILFTGDIVNRHASELKPFMSVLSQLHAPEGVWSIMGNHDYGDYYTWPSPEAKQADIDSLKAMQADMGWRMLNNDHAWIYAGGDSIALVGVENIGDRPFPVYGSLAQAYPDIADSNIKILMSHNPAHWCDSIADKTGANVALTLAGHTHAMQIEVFGLSPAALRYKTWGGLYTDTLGRNLYVNIGAGTVGIPMRLGATPEITLITLMSK